MANFPYFDPGDSEVLSPLIAGLTEGLNKLSDILNLTTSQQKNLTMEKMTWVNQDGSTVVGKLYQAPQGKKMWLPSPTPVIKKNGTVITQTNDHFRIDYVGGSLFFEDGFLLKDSDIVTADFTFVTPNSSVIDAITQATSTLEDMSQDVGNRLSSVEYMSFQNDFSVPIATDDAEVTLLTDDDGLAILAEWEYLQAVPGDYYNREETDVLLEQMEPEIVSKGDFPLAEEYYYNGRKQWSSLPEKVLGTTLDGLSTDSNVPIEDSDTVLSAAGKLQRQVSERVTQTDFDEFKSNIPAQDAIAQFSFKSPDGSEIIVNGTQVGNEYSTEFSSHTYGNDAIFNVVFNEQLYTKLHEYGATYIVAETDGAGNVRFLADKQIRASSIHIPVNVYHAQGASLSSYRGTALTVTENIDSLKSKVEYRETRVIPLSGGITTQNTTNGWFETQGFNAANVGANTVVDVLFNPNTITALSNSGGSWIAVENNNGTLKVICDVSISTPLEITISYMRNI